MNLMLKPRAKRKKPIGTENYFYRAVIYIYTYILYTHTHTHTHIYLLSEGVPF